MPLLLLVIAIIAESRQSSVRPSKEGNSGIKSSNEFDDSDDFPKPKPNYITDIEYLHLPDNIHYHDFSNHD